MRKCCLLDLISKQQYSRLISSLVFLKSQGCTIRVFSHLSENEPVCASLLCPDAGPGTCGYLVFGLDLHPWLTIKYKSCKSFWTWLIITWWPCLLWGGRSRKSRNSQRAGMIHDLVASPLALQSETFYSRWQIRQKWALWLQSGWLKEERWGEFCAPSSKEASRLTRRSNFKNCHDSSIKPHASAVIRGQTWQMRMKWSVSNAATVISFQRHSSHKTYFGSLLLIAPQPFVWGFCVWRGCDWQWKPM